MREPRQDAERVAALLDGRLDPREREALLAELAASDEARDALADAAAVLRDLEAAGHVPALDLPAPGSRPPGTSADVPPAPTDAPGDSSGDVPLDRPSPVVGDIRPRARRRIGGWWGGLAAAVVLGAVGLSLFRRAGAPLDDPARLVAELGTDAARPARPIPWRATRGAPALEPRARAVRFGALAVELELAARARDTATATLAARAAALLDDVPAAGPAAQRYRAVAAAAGAPADSLRALLQGAWQASVGVLDTDVRTGAWLAAARAAAAAADDAFFRAPGSRRALDALAARTDLPSDARDAVMRLRAAGDDAAPDRPARARDVDAVLAALGG